MILFKVNVKKLRQNSKVPHRAHISDAGMDFFFCPADGDSIYIEPGTSNLLQTGVKIEVPQDCMLQVMNKSGVSSKRSLVTGACVVDCGYDGEIFVNLHNVGLNAQCIEPGQKIAQGVFVVIKRPSLQETEGNIYPEETSRGPGALGSTGDS